MNIAGNDFLAGAAFAGDQDGGFGARDLIGQADDRLHGRIVDYHRPVIVGDSGQHGRDHLGVWWQRNEFFGTSSDRGSRPVGIWVHSAGDNWRANTFGLIGRNQRGDIQVVIHQQQVSTLAGAQCVSGSRNGLDMADLCAGRHGHFYSCCQLPVQFSDD